MKFAIVNPKEATSYTDIPECSTPVGIVEFNFVEYRIKLNYLYNTQTHIIVYTIDGVKMQMVGDFASKFSHEDNDGIIKILCNKIAQQNNWVGISDSLYQEVLDGVLISKSNYVPAADQVISISNYVPSSDQVISTESQKLPGVQTKVEFPCACYDMVSEKVGAGEGGFVNKTIKRLIPFQARIWTIIQHLNDSHKWSREKIADWLDELHDKGEINIEFAPWGQEPVKNENPCADVIPDSWVNFEKDMELIKAMQYYSVMDNTPIITNLITGA